MTWDLDTETIIVTILRPIKHMTDIVCNWNAKLGAPQRATPRTVVVFFNIEIKGLHQAMTVNHQSPVTQQHTVDRLADSHTVM